jgi:hypothetical protein
MPALRSKVAYANKVSKPGFYLECVDGFLACLYFGYEYRIVVGTQLEDFKVVAFQDVLLQLEIDADMLPAGPLKRDSKETLCLACCAANFSTHPCLRTITFQSCSKSSCLQRYGSICQRSFPYVSETASGKSVVRLSSQTNAMKKNWQGTVLIRIILVCFWYVLAR